MRPKKRILLVDASDARQSVRRFLLETRGYSVMQARSGEEALEQLQWMQHEIACKPDTIDLLLIDDSVAEAPELSAAVWARLPSLPVVIVTKRSPAEMLELIETQTSRRRGPKRQMPDTPLSRAASTSCGDRRFA